jgi:hypothetical protein
LVVLNDPEAIKPTLDIDLPDAYGVRLRMSDGTLTSAILRHITKHNDDPKLFTWTKTTSQILAKLNPLNAPVHLDAFGAQWAAHC